MPNQKIMPTGFGPFIQYIFFGVKFGAKVRNFYDMSKEYFKIIDFDDAAVADFAAEALFINQL